MPKFLPHGQAAWRSTIAPALAGLFGVLFTAVVAAQDAGSVMLASNPQLGSILAAANGMTLYTYDRDERGTGTSACYDTCSTRWPTFEVSSTPVGVEGDFTTFMRTDGVMQAALDGWPLYYFQNDANPGDTAGDGVGGVWHIVPLSAAQPVPEGDPSESAAPAAALAVGTTRDPQGRTVLTDANGMSLYGLAQDRGNDNKSTCYADNECAVYWPPVLIQGTPMAPEGLSGQLGTQQRADFTTQLTYNGGPLYTYLADRQPGDMFGSNLTDEWGFWFLIPAQ